MAKYYNNRVKTGKLAGSVFAVRYGETIERAYQPVVSNPSTTGQVEARAKLKALSQLCAVVAPQIAIPRVGSLSSRNIFTKKNYFLVSYAVLTASIDLENIQLTDSVVGFPGLQVTRGEGTEINVQLNRQFTEINRVVYVSIVEGSDGKLRLGESAVASTPGGGAWPATINNYTLERSIILGYGVRDNTDAARAKFGNLEAVDASTVAQLVVTRTLSESDITLTETRGAEVPASA